MNDDIIKINGLKFFRADKVIFDGVDLNIKRGKITAIMGPSGSGKTTLLKLIGAQLYPEQGGVLFNGINIHKLSRKELYKTRRSMGLMFQSGALFTNLSVFENVAFPLREHTELPEDMIRDLVLMQLEAVGLRGARDLMPSELSGGMARRVALARTLIKDPKLMMYDEPFTGQDPITMGVLMRLIKNANDVLKLTSIIVSHDVAETASIADYIYIIANGKIVGHGEPDAVMQDNSPWVDQFVHGLPDGAMPFHYPAKNYYEDLLNA
ncbi:MAG: ABC transporter ATP-binding protein [Gammaproteobacteria bacterium]|nr:ABC transporter ATP-binding protein [Gammaproteobacteria bacterium]